MSTTAKPLLNTVLFTQFVLRRFNSFLGLLVTWFCKFAHPTKNQNMKSITTRLLTILLITASLSSRADEGMWLYNHLSKVFPHMKALGLKLSPEDIYSINQSSLKDAVVSLQFCTAEIVSPQGLMLTNHHCAYDVIQYHSDTVNNYLKNGFWADSYSDELEASGVTASILVRVEDVTELINNAVAGTSEDLRDLRRLEIMDSLETAATEGTDNDAEVVDMFAGNQHVLFVYTTYTDVRLVGAPPESIGKFGGDTDNWEWPRHTGDFSLLRIYMAPDGSPAPYSEDNIPYVPKHFFPLSIEGADKGDYAMIMGFPGSTDRYSTSYGIELAKEQTNPQSIKLRDTRLNIWKEAMQADEEVNIQYASKFSQISNYWKYFIGQNQGLERLGTIDQKRAFEQDFLTWAGGSSARNEYSDVFSEFEAGYKDYAKYDTYWTYMIECIFANGAEILELAWRFRRLERTIENGGDQDAINGQVERIRGGLPSFFKDYQPWLDQKVFGALMKHFHDDVPANQLPEIVTKYNAKFKGDWNKAAAWVYKKSFLDSKAGIEAFLKDPTTKALRKDPAYLLSVGIVQNYIDNISGPYNEAVSRIEDASKLYIRGLMEKNGDEPMYPDANSTPRLTFGKVIDYFPRDAVQYQHFTTTDGILEKYVPDDDEFHVPADYLKLIKKGDFGRYGKDGQLNVCLLTDNDITGGNSGSPVINGNGHLIGIAFDGNWEAMTGDLVYDDELKRTISVDIRYVLFVIDKYAGAQNLIDEMTIVE